MSFDPILADTRFGCGRSPKITPPQDVNQILRGFSEPDEMARRFQIESTEVFMKRFQERFDLGRIRREAKGTAQAEAAQIALRKLDRKARHDSMRWMTAHLLRRVHSSTPFLERIESFWADHFTTSGKQVLTRRMTSPFVESAIRPRIGGRFEDLLIAAIIHPLMLWYLDQGRSVGPNSTAVLKGSKAHGLNENLARELLELHTLGVDGPYTQRDVRELAELLTGLLVNVEHGLHFREDLAEPGSETILGKIYGGAKAHVSDIRAALRDLARHPATADHIARKLAVHFVSDQPDPTLVAAIKTAWLDSGGELVVIYRALLSHSAAWHRDRANIKLPFDYVASALRALAVAPEALENLKETDYRARFLDPLRLMGHVWQRPKGPDGLPEQDSAWITPQGIAARLQWAISVPQLLTPDLPDPRTFVTTALGPDAPEAVRFAAEAAESRADGIGMILISPAFQRM